MGEGGRKGGGERERERIGELEAEGRRKHRGKEVCERRREK